MLLFLLQWTGAAVVNSQLTEGQQSNVPTTVANGQPASSAGVSTAQIDRQMNGSRFNPDKNRELQKLPLLKGLAFYLFICCVQQSFFNFTMFSFVVPRSYPLIFVICAFFHSAILFF